MSTDKHASLRPSTSLLRHVLVLGALTSLVGLSACGDELSPAGEACVRYYEALAKFYEDAGCTDEGQVPDREFCETNYPEDSSCNAEEAALLECQADNTNTDACASCDLSGAQCGLNACAEQASALAACGGGGA